jgi:dihydrofolate synthase/folylpolyglutamate synthase
MDFDSATSYINSFINFEKIPKYKYTSSFKLERMSAILEELGNPHLKLKTLHVAGSKGKGSTCIIIASILKEAGYRVGLYTSPHLIDFRERIRVLGEGRIVEDEELEGFEGAIGRNEFIDLIENIKSVAEKYREHKILGRSSFFEILTVCAFLYFIKQKVDFVVLETGLGGRLDATNVTIPLVCGISDISFEHTDKLGNSLEKIAKEKAGIIKDRGIVVSSSREKEALDVIRQISQEKNAILYEIGKDIIYSSNKRDKKGQVFNIDGPGYSYKDLQLNLIGDHQVKNASLAIGMLKAVDSTLNVEEEAIRRGLKDVFWPGRLQVIQEEPYLVLDGAHNVTSIKTLISSIKELFKYNRLICIFGISKDKDIKGVCKELNKICDITILTKSKCTARAEEPILLKGHFSKPRVEITDDIGEALERGKRLAEKEDMILITGSLFLVGDAIKCLNATPLSKKYTFQHC